MPARWQVREPFCGWSHLFGAVLSFVGWCVLLSLSQGRPWHQTAFLIYGGSLVLLYAASTLYHSLPATPRRVEQLLMVDQVAIYLLIAGTYTPLCLIPLRGPIGWLLLGVIWGIALVGITLRIGWRTAPRRLHLSLYLLMGWLCLLAYQPLARALPGSALAWFFGGGIVYTIGTALLVAQRPRLWPGVFSTHELWHLFVLAGSACHFALMLSLAAPA